MPGHGALGELPVGVLDDTAGADFVAGGARALTARPRRRAAVPEPRLRALLALKKIRTVSAN